MKSHSKTIVCLLLAATFAVDLVVGNWLAEMGQLSRIAYVYEALVTAQLAVVTIWAVLGFGTTLFKWIAVAAAIGIAGLATARLEDLKPVESVGIYASFVTLLALTLWMLKQTGYWKRLNGTAVEKIWQFSLTHLLIVMTVVALLISAMRRSFVFSENDLWKSYALLTIGDVLLATGTIIAWRWTRSKPAMFPIWIPRLGVVSVVALAVGLTESMLALSGALGQTFAADLARAKFDLITYSYIASFVIFIYLELTPIVRLKQPATSVPPIEKPQP